ncbi:MAG: BamA/TamA family outer membrane protein [Vicingaceae bacterium]
MIKSKFLYLLLSLSLLFACGPARHLKEDQRLLNKVELKYKKDSKYEDELISLARQKPNRKFLGLFKIYLGIYNLYYEKEDSKVKEKIGEPPVIYDSSLNETSANLMRRYLNNKGYYDNQVNVSHKLKKKKAKLTFHIDKGKRYKIADTEYEIPDTTIRRFFMQDSAKSEIKVGEPFDLDLLKEERVRIEEMLKDKGYFKFSREFVVFEADTFKNKKTARVDLNIKNVEDKYEDTDSLIERNHQRYTISQVIVRTNYALRDKVGEADSVRHDSILFLYYGPKEFKHQALARLISLRPGQFFRAKRQELTYTNLSGLGTFSLVSIQYEEDYSSNKNDLIVYIDLNPYKQMSLSLQTEGTNNGGNLGINSNITFQNKNTFKGAERLSISFRGGLEVQQILTDNDQEDLDIGGGFLPFNTFEFGPRVNLEVPRFMIPFVSSKRFSSKGNPRTTFSASFNYQERPDYIRNVSSAYVAYSWNETPTKTHIIQPIDLSFIKLNPSKSFEEVLNSLENPFLRNSYTDNLILALKYSFIYNNQGQKSNKNSTYFRANIESAGNTISALANENIFKQNEDGSYNIGGIRYAQYIRTDLDLRYYQNLVYNNKLVYRLSTGLGIPYGNSKAMPFEKSFYAGGANNIRAWRARELGPGTLPDSSESDVDQIGNMQIVGNLEFRFPITDLFEGAAFLDAGNIWNLDQEDSRQSTEFQFSSLWRSTAIGLGMGLRLNFSFFILRMDVATPFKDPSVIDPTLLKPRWRQTNLNFGIGYPF